MSPKRSPFAGRIARAAKRRLDRHAAAHTPAHIRAVGAPIEVQDRAYLRRKLGMKLQRMGYGVGVLQGNLGQKERDRVMRSFRSGKIPILLATNVAARGLDVLHIERVINYDLPETHDLFTHRVGRTGRMGRSGRAITLLGPADLPKWHEIERGLGRKLPRVDANGQAVAPPAPAPASNGHRKRGVRSYVRSTRGPRRR